ncbi:MAG: SDR family NAD(P)-dependent oxidoreductase [Nocardia sp.]|nr:SDR family NAD(P)-dependent oxidoreductase [Nocardia sp.]
MFGLENLPSFGGRARTREATAVVTGAGSGIGRAFALEIAHRGGTVICADIDESRAVRTVALIERDHPGHAYAFACDVADRDAVESLARYAEAAFAGPPSLVVNNAGIGSGGMRVGETGFDTWERVVGVNLWGVVNGCEIFAPLLRSAGRGGFINVASAAAFGTAPGMGVYNATKAGVLALSETMAAEFSDTDIAVTVLCPTFVRTNVIADGITTRAAAQIAEKGMRWGGFSPDRVARITLDAHDHGRLHVLPQLDAKFIWFVKRLFPAQYTMIMGLLERLVAMTDSESAGQHRAEV